MVDIDKAREYIAKAAQALAEADGDAPQVPCKPEENKTPGIVLELIRGEKTDSIRIVPDERLVKGSKVRVAGQGFNVVGTSEGGAVLALDQKVGNAAGAVLAKYEVISVPAEPAPAPAPVPEPEKPAVVAQGKVNDFGTANPDWDGGVYTRNGKSFSMPYDEAVIQAAGSAYAEFEDGSSANVVSANSVDKRNMTVSTDSKLSGRAISGKAVKIVRGKIEPKASEDTPPVIETPAPSAPKPAPGDASFKRRKVGRVGFNFGMGAGADADKYIPGIYGTTHGFWTEPELKRAVGYGAEIGRGGFLMARMVAGLGGKLRTGDNSDPVQLRNALALAGRYGIKFILDNHTYGFGPSNGASNKQMIGSAGYPADVWAKDWGTLIDFLAQDSEAWAAIDGFDLCNEPIYQDDATWTRCLQTAVTYLAPKAKGKRMILEGIRYASCTDWVNNNPTIHTVTHPDGKEFIEFSAHLYLDPGRDGYYDENGNQIVEALDDKLHPNDIAAGITFDTVGTARLEGYLNWLIRHNVNGNLGENLVPGNLPNLMRGERNMSKKAIENGIDLYYFGLSDRFGDSNPHNIEITAATARKINGVPMFDNTEMLKCAKDMAAYSKSLRK